MYYGAHVKLLGRQGGEAFCQVETHLMAEDAESTGSCSIVLVDTFRENSFKKIQVLKHFSKLQHTWMTMALGGSIDYELSKRETDNE
jgi:hypothetical protein